MLPPEALAGYLDNDLPGEERRRVELHLASCAACREEVADIRRLQAGRRRRRTALFVIPALAAATLLVAIAIPRETTQSSAVRSATQNESLVSVVTPAPDGVVTGPLTFRWRSAGAGATYTITLQGSDGGVVWTASTSDTTAVPPPTLVLPAESTWFWSVDAVLSDGRSRSSGALRFRTGS